MGLRHRILAPIEAFLLVAHICCILQFLCVLHFLRHSSRLFAVPVFLFICLCSLCSIIRKSALTLLPIVCALSVTLGFTIFGVIALMWTDEDTIQISVYKLGWQEPVNDVLVMTRDNATLSLGLTVITEFTEMLICLRCALFYIEGGEPLHTKTYPVQAQRIRMNSEFLPEYRTQPVSYWCNYHTPITRSDEYALETQSVSTFESEEAPGERNHIHVSPYNYMGR